MGWEVAINETNSGRYNRYMFFCNTADRAFGPVFYLNFCPDISSFYNAGWKVNSEDFPDPRVLPEDMLWKAIERMKVYFGKEDSDESLDGTTKGVIS